MNCGNPYDASLSLSQLTLVTLCIQSLHMMHTIIRIMMCVGSVKYMILVNNGKVGLITPGKGLHQGDPLFLDLFILCVEGFSALIRKAERVEDAHGVKICRESPSITNMLYTNDCFLFFRAFTQEGEAIRKILGIYRKTSIQKLNVQKSEIFFTCNVRQAERDAIKEGLRTGKYLGIPSMVGTSRKATFKHIKDRVWKRLKSWRVKFLSIVG